MSKIASHVRGHFVAYLALFFALGGTAGAATTVTATTHKDAKADTKLVKNLAPSLSVKHAKTADSATSAASATHATTADNATNAASATNAADLGGHPASAYVLSGTSGEVFHFVGDPGEPAFQNGWGNYGNGFQRASFYMDPIRRVHLDGVVTGSNTGTTVFTLPPLDRPFGNQAFAVAAGAGPGLEDVDVFSNGNVFAFGSQTVVALDGISFVAGD